MCGQGGVPEFGEKYRSWSMGQLVNSFLSCSVYDGNDNKALLF
jgi:hypothetical protein